ncbi:unnamed protein product [Symbiodinium natans]|uniref:Uncharacterized protein n=1 Tax=Symbiodinium natans TaxID=878477 RepID=A0A812KMI4_9DINO|nr:unnamed protein product [Symbiodinium natans]
MYTPCAGTDIFRTWCIVNFAIEFGLSCGKEKPPCAMICAKHVEHLGPPDADGTANPLPGDLLSLFQARTLCWRHCWQWCKGVAITFDFLLAVVLFVSRSSSLSFPTGFA